jgi:hypothetical protein
VSGINMGGSKSMKMIKEARTGVDANIKNHIREQ